MAGIVGLSFCLNQWPFLLTARPWTFGADGDSALHFALQLRLRDPQLFARDIELDLYAGGRPTFESAIHRTVVLVADGLFGGDLFVANMACFWALHVAFIIGSYLLGNLVLGSRVGAALFAASGVGLSRALFSWWGMVYAAVIPHYTVGLLFVPWTLWAYLRWCGQPRRMLVLFSLLGLAANLYPLQPAYLAAILLGVELIQGGSLRTRLGRGLALGGAFLLFALPTVVASAATTFVRMSELTAAERAVAEAMFVRHYGYLLPQPRLGATLASLRSPLWWFLAGAAAAWLSERRAGRRTEPARRLAWFAVGAASLAVFGLFVAGVSRPLATFLFHRASALAYVPAYLGCSVLAVRWMRSRSPAARAAAIVLAAAMLHNGARHTALFFELRGQRSPLLSDAFFDLCDWARSQTPVGSLFMVPAVGHQTYYALRALGQRAVLLNMGMGELVLSDPRGALRVWALARDVEPLYREGAESDAFVRVARKYGADYIVTDDSTPRPPVLPLAYSNGPYRVFRTRPQPAARIAAGADGVRP